MIQELHQTLLPDLISIVQEYIAFPLYRRGIFKYKGADIITFQQKFIELFVILKEIKQEADMSYTYLFKQLKYVRESTYCKNLTIPIEILCDSPIRFHESQWSHEKMCFADYLGQIFYFSNCTFIPR